MSGSQPRKPDQGQTLENSLECEVRPLCLLYSRCWNCWHSSNSSAPSSSLMERWRKNSWACRQTSSSHLDSQILHRIGGLGPDAFGRVGFAGACSSDLDHQDSNTLKVWQIVTVILE